MKKGVIWMLHSVEADSVRTERSPLFRNLTVSPSFLEEQIVRAREKGWRFLSGEEFQKQLHDGQEHKNILVTIDDGFRNVYTEAFPVFKRQGVPFVFFVSTALIERGFRICPYAQLDGLMAICDIAPQVGKDPDRCFRKYRRIKRWLPWLDGRRVLRHVLGTEIDFDGYFRTCVVSPAELREMTESGLCEVGSHTDRHVHVDRTRNVERELVESKAKIEAWTGRPCTCFSFPYGHADQRSAELVRRHFKWATKDVREPPYEVTSDSDDWMLPRMFFDEARLREWNSL